jgi:hypothetical protein
VIDEDAMTETPKEMVLTVSPGRVEVVVEKLQKLAKRANKLGLAPPTWKVSDIQSKQVKNAWSGKVTTEYFYLVTVDPQIVKLPGYTFLGTAEADKVGNILYPVPGAKIDEKFRHSEGYCDHCQKIRDRKALYFFSVDATGEQLQVGKQCLRDFMGADAQSLAYYAHFEQDLSGGDDEEGYGGSSGYYVNLIEFMAITGAVIDVVGGYVSFAAAKAAGQDYGVTTANKVAIARYPNKKSDDELKFAAQVEEKVKTGGYWEKAEEAARYMLEDWKNTSDYAHNIRVLLTKGYLSSDKQYGIGASIYPAYLREVGRMKELELQRKLEAEKAEASVFVGKIGERLKKIPAQVTMAAFIKSGDWGDTYLYKFTTEKGEILTWFSSPRGLNKGDKVILTGTVKDHKEYKGIQETQLTRCAVETKEAVA